MFRPQTVRQAERSPGFEFLELLYHATVRHLRGNRSNAVTSLVMNVLQAAVMLAMFVFMFDLLGLRRIKIRGDFVVYVMSGVFMFMTHTKALAAVSAADSPTSSLMMHAPMNPILAVTSAALASLYQQLFAAAVIMIVYHSVWNPIEIHDMVGAVSMFILSWFSGATIGLLFYAVKPWSPDIVMVASLIYQRANMIASGKMMPANMAAAKTRSMFDWNPLYHTIDMGRNYAFLDYNARFTSVSYPVYCALVFIMIGLMGQFFTRKYASASWGKR